MLLKMKNVKVDWKDDGCYLLTRFGDAEMTSTDIVITRTHLPERHPPLTRPTVSGHAEATRSSLSLQSLKYVYFFPISKSIGDFWIISCQQLVVDKSQLSQKMR
jgi:hypothetical protein